MSHALKSQTSIDDTLAHT